MTEGLELKGFDEIQKAFEKSAYSLGEYMSKALLEAGHVIQASATQKCPIDIGHLRAGILTRVNDEEDAIVSVTVGIHPDTVVSDGIEYAPYIEYGTGIYAENGQGRKEPWNWKGAGGKYAGWHRTSGMHAQPFMRPAYDENIEECYDIIGEYIDKNLAGESA